MTHQEKLEELKKLIPKEKITIKDILMFYSKDQIRAMSYESRPSTPIGKITWTIVKFDLEHLTPPDSKEFIWDVLEDDLNSASIESVDVLYEYLIFKNHLNELSQSSIV